MALNERITRVWVGDQDEHPPASAQHALYLGQHLRISAEDIARYCGANTPPLADDLAVICGAIVYADRKTSRRRGDCWGRKFELDVPLLELSTFVSSNLGVELEDLLHFLTGDEWRVAFRRRTRRPPFQQPLPLGENYLVTMPFSGGLDSFAGYRLLASAHGEAQVLRVTTSRRTPANTVGVSPLFVPFETADQKREGSYRSRVFPYFVFAALAASATNCNRVVIPENGQGSLGPALIPFRDEWPFRSCHPAFVARLQRWMSALLGRAVVFEQPYVHRTKGSVLTELSARGLATGWEATRSCSADPRQGYGKAGCGFCGGCVLRRVAVSAAGLTSQEDRYGFEDWSVAEAVVAAKGGMRAFAPVEREIGAYAIRSMAEFANLESSDGGRTRIELEARSIDRDGSDFWSRVIRSLRNAHEVEWRAVLDHLPADAWFRHVAEGVA